MTIGEEISRADPLRRARLLRLRATLNAAARSRRCVLLILFGAIVAGLIAGWACFGFHVAMVFFAFAGTIVGITGHSLYERILTSRSRRDGLIRGKDRLLFGLATAGRAYVECPLVCALSASRDEALIRVWRVDGAFLWKSRDSFWELPKEAIEEIHLERSKVLVVSLFGGPCTESGDRRTSFARTAHRLVLHGPFSASPLTVAESLDPAPILALARGLCTLLSQPLHDSSSGSMAILAAEDVDRPYLVPVATRLAPTAEIEEESEGKGQGPSIRYTHPVLQGRAWWPTIGRWLSQSFALSGAWILIAWGAVKMHPLLSHKVLFAIPLAMLVIPLVRFLAGRVPLRISLETARGRVVVEERWGPFASRTPIPLDHLLRIVEDPTGLLFVMADRTLTLPSREPAMLRRALENELVHRFGLAPPGNFFRRLLQVHPWEEGASSRERVGKVAMHGRYVLRHRGHRLVLDTVRDRAGFPPFLHLVNLGPDLDEAMKRLDAANERLRKVQAATEALAEARPEGEGVLKSFEAADWARRYLSSADGSLQHLGRLLDEQTTCCRVTLHGDRLQGGPRWQLVLAADGWREPLREEGFAPSGFGPVWCRGDAAVLNERLREHPSTVARLGLLSKEIPGTLLDISAVRCLCRVPGLSLGGDRLRRMIQVLDELLSLLARTPVEKDGETVFLELVVATEGCPTCQFCGYLVEEDAVRCLSCETVHHEACWRMGGGCTTYACGQTAFRPVETTKARRVPGPKGPSCGE